MVQIQTLVVNQLSFSVKSVLVGFTKIKYMQYKTRHKAIKGWGLITLPLWIIPFILYIKIEEFINKYFISSEGVKDANGNGGIFGTA